MCVYVEENLVVLTCNMIISCNNLQQATIKKLNESQKSTTKKLE